jgi:hypothetical protein
MRLAHSLKLSLALAGSLMLAACSNDTEPVTAPITNSGTPGIVAGTLEAHATRPTLTLRNTTEFVVGYMVVDKDQAVIALYPPCGPNCPTLRQGESVTLNYAAISGYTPASTEAIVMWWKYVRRTDGSLTPDGGIQTRKVRLD